HRVRDVVRERGDAVDLDAGREFEFVTRDGGPNRRTGQPGVDAELAQGRFEHLATRVDQAPVDLPVTGTLERRDRRQLPGARHVTGAERNRELFAGARCVVPARRRRFDDFFLVFFLVVLDLDVVVLVFNFFVFFVVGFLFSLAVVDRGARRATGRGEV